MHNKLASPQAAWQGIFKEKQQCCTFTRDLIWDTWDEEEKKPRIRTHYLSVTWHVVYRCNVNNVKYDFSGVWASPEAFHGKSFGLLRDVEPRGRRQGPRKDGPWLEARDRWATTHPCFMSLKTFPGFPLESACAEIPACCITNIASSHKTLSTCSRSLLTLWSPPPWAVVVV